MIAMMCMSADRRSLLGLPGFKARLNGRLGQPLQQRWSISDYAQAYASGAATPADVAENILRFTRESEQQDPPMRYFIFVDEADVRMQAAKSTERCVNAK
jgi:hypothetical protein